MGLVWWSSRSHRWGSRDRCPRYCRPCSHPSRHSYRRTQYTRRASVALVDYRIGLPHRRSSSTSGSQQGTRPNRMWPDRALYKMNSKQCSGLWDTLRLKTPRMSSGRDQREYSLLSGATTCSLLNCRAALHISRGSRQRRAQWVLFQCQSSLHSSSGRQPAPIHRTTHSWHRCHSTLCSSHWCHHILPWSTHCSRSGHLAREV